MADYKKFSLRLDYDNPEHDKIITAIENIDKRAFKNKNQFVISALKYYIDYLNVSEAEKLLNERRENLEEIIVTRREFEDRISIIKAELKSELYEDMVSLMRTTADCKREAIGHKDVGLVEQKSDTEQSDEDLSMYSGIMESVMSWSNPD